MRERVSLTLCVCAALALLAVLVWPYVQKPVAGVTVYYASGPFSPLLVGVFAIGVLLVIAGDRGGYISDELGTGIAIGLAVVTFLIALAWAITARVDVFLASGWAVPAHRFIVVGLSALILVGIGWHAWANSHFSRPI